MKYKMLIAAVLIAALSLMGVAATSAQSGQATLVIVNYVGSQMSVTLDDMSYVVPSTDTVPEGGQLELNLPAGQHELSATIPGGPGSNIQLDLAPGQTFLLGARTELGSELLDAEGNVLESPKDILVLFETSLTPAAPAPEPTRSPLLPIPSGQGALVLDNYIGEDLILTINTMLYTVPANGRLQLDLAPGELSYSASAGVSGTNGAAQIVPGEYTGLGFSRDIPPEQPDYEEGKPNPTPVPLKIHVTEISLAGEAAAASPVETPEVAATEAAPAQAPAATGEPGLTVINYTPHPLTFTIDNSAYQLVEDGGEANITLAPGKYSFTAATPWAAVNGELELGSGEEMRLSISANVAGSELMSYVE